MQKVNPLNLVSLEHQNGRNLAKVKGAIQDIAKDLIKLYSTRYNARGFVYEEDSIWQKEFEAMFPYEETWDKSLKL